MDEEKIIAGIDIGTTKIATVVARVDEYNSINIIGVGTHPSTGLRRGVVINIEKTIESIKKSVQQAELMAGYKIERAYAGIAGDHIRSINSKGVIAVSGEGKIIDQRDVDRVIDAAKAIALPMDRQIVHILPQEYIVDDQDGIKNPVGMAGTRLECEVHIVTASATAIQNIINCVKKAGCEVNKIVLEPYASSLAVLDSDELDLGVAIMDIGGGTTDLAVFFDGSIRFTSVIGLGGTHVTSDLSHGLRTPVNHAEEIKKNYGFALQSMIEADELVRVPGIGDRAPRDISRAVLCQIIQPRMEEMFELALKELQRSGLYETLGAGLVLTGGASLMPGTADLAEKVIGLPAKIGTPKVSSGLVEAITSPVYATAVGLIFFGRMESRTFDDEDEPREDKFYHKIIKWLKKQFEEIL